MALVADTSRVLRVLYCGTEREQGKQSSNLNLPAAKRFIKSALDTKTSEQASPGAGAPAAATGRSTGGYTWLRHVCHAYVCMGLAVTLVWRWSACVAGKRSSSKAPKQDSRAGK